jgi:hypothetical protein
MAPAQVDYHLDEGSAALDVGSDSGVVVIMTGLYGR